MVKTKFFATKPVLLLLLNLTVLMGLLSVGSSVAYGQSREHIEEENAMEVGNFQNLKEAKGKGVLLVNKTGRTFYALVAYTECWPRKSGPLKGNPDCVTTFSSIEIPPYRKIIAFAAGENVRNAEMLLLDIENKRFYEGDAGVGYSCSYLLDKAFKYTGTDASEALQEYIDRKRERDATEMNRNPQLYFKILNINQTLEIE